MVTPQITQCYFKTLSQPLADSLNAPTRTGHQTGGRCFDRTLFYPRHLRVNQKAYGRRESCPLSRLGQSLFLEDARFATFLAAIRLAASGIPGSWLAPPVRTTRLPTICPRPDWFSPVAHQFQRLFHSCTDNPRQHRARILIGYIPLIIADGRNGDQIAVVGSTWQGGAIHDLQPLGVFHTVVKPRATSIVDVIAADGNRTRHE